MLWFVLWVHVRVHMRAYTWAPAKTVNVSLSNMRSETKYAHFFITNWELKMKMLRFIRRGLIKPTSNG